MGLHSLWSFSDAFRNSDFSFLHFSLPFYFHISLYTTGAKRHSIPSESIYISVLTDKKRNVVSKCNERGGVGGEGVRVTRMELSNGFDYHRRRGNMHLPNPRGRIYFPLCYWLGDRRPILNRSSSRRGGVCVCIPNISWHDKIRSQK